MLSGLAALKLADNTLVVLVADHGEGLGQHDEPTHGQFIYEATLHVPLVIRCPGRVPAGQRIAAQVRTIDIAPTILQLAGVAPWDELQGTSLMPLLDGSAADLQLAAYSESIEAHAEFGFSRLRSITADGWKYILSTKPALYHIADTPDELANQIAEQPERAERMRAQLRELLAGAPPIPTDDVAVALSDEGSSTARIPRLRREQCRRGDGRDGAGALRSDGRCPARLRRDVSHVGSHYLAACGRRIRRM